MTLLLLLRSAAGGATTDAPAGVATATGVAQSATVAVSANAGVATGTGAALAPAVSSSVKPGVATATGVAQTATPSVGAQPGVATGTGVAQAATAATSGNTAAPAGVATGTGVAVTPKIAASVPAGVATATGAANAAKLTISTKPGAATGTGAALPPSTSGAVASNPPTAVRPSDAFGYSSTVTLNWTAPSFNGGTAITDYRIRYSSNDGSSWSTWSHSASTAVTAAVTGLVNGTRYLFEVAAVNAAGTSTGAVSEWGSTPVAATAPKTPPSSSTRTGSGYAISRIDQRNGPPGTNAVSTWTGAGVRVYVIDGGCRYTHNDFANQAFATAYAFDGSAVNNTDYSHGHECCSNAVGLTVGVAYDATLVPVKCYNVVAGTRDLVDAYEWVRDHHPAGTPGVVSSSNLMGNNTTDRDGRSGQTELDACMAVVTQIINTTGLAWIQCMGNTFSPTFIVPDPQPGMVLVGGSDASDNYWTSSVLSADTDLCSPSDAVPVAGISSDSAYGTDNGTSFGTPLVAGVVACWLEANPTLTPRQISDLLLSSSTKGVLSGTSGGAPNRLVYSLADIPPVAVDVTPGVATGTGVANGATAKVAVSAATATGAGVAFPSSASAAVKPGVATGTGVAQTVTTTRTSNANAGLATATGTANQPTVTTSGTTNAPAGVATGTGAALSPTATVATLAGVATGTGAALAATVSTSAPAGTATGVGVAYNPTTKGTANPATATGVGAALAPTVSTTSNTNAPAGVATATGLANPATGNTGAAPATATGTGVAYNPTLSLTSNANPATATGVGTALQATVSTSSSANAPAGVANATGTANGATTGTGATASPGAAVGVVPQAATGVTVQATTAGAVGQAYSATMLTAATLATATAAGVAYAARISISTQAGVATGTGVAYNANPGALAPVFTGPLHTRPGMPARTTATAVLERTTRSATPPRITREGHQ